MVSGDWDFEGCSVKRLMRIGAYSVTGFTWLLGIWSSSTLVFGVGNFLTLTAII